MTTLTSKEAIYLLKRMEKDAEHYGKISMFGRHGEIEKAIEALKKQEPKKVEDYHHCSNCGYGLPAKGITDKWCECCYEWKYCPECGQALKWR